MPIAQDGVATSSPYACRVVAFVGLAVLLILTPGPNQALLTSRVLQDGRRAGLAAVGGLATGMALHVAAALAGLSALLTASAEVFGAVRLAGGIYLVLLGVAALRAAGRRRETGPPVATPSRGRAYRAGVVSMTLNPKAAVFFVAVVPQFVTPGPGAQLRVAALLLLYGAMSLVFWVSLVLAVGHARELLRRPGVRAGLERATGAALVALGVGLAADRA